MAKATREEENSVRWMLLKTDAEGDPAVVDRRAFSVQITGGPVTVYGRVSSADDFVPLADRRGVRIQEVTTGLYYIDTPLHSIQPVATETATVAIALART